MLEVGRSCRTTIVGGRGSTGGRCIFSGSRRVCGSGGLVPLRLFGVQIDEEPGAMLMELVEDDRFPGCVTYHVSYCGFH